MAQRSRLEGDITLLKVSFVFNYQSFILAELDDSSDFAENGIF